MSETLTWASNHGFDCPSCGHSDKPCGHWKQITNAMPPPMTTLPDTQARAEQRERADSLRKQLDDFIDRDGMWDTVGQAIDCIAAALAAEGLRQRLAEHKRGCTVRLGSCARCIELGDEDSIKLAQRQLAATQPGATGEEGR